MVKGQLSLEMMVILVIILGLVVIVANTMIKSANRASEKVEQKTEAIFNTSDFSAAIGSKGDYCATGEDCRSGMCNEYTAKCD